MFLVDFISRVEVVVADAGVDVLVSLGVKARIVAFESSRRIVKSF